MYIYIYILSARILNQWWLLAHHNLPPITMCLSKQIRHSVSFPFIKTVPYGSIRKCLHREPWLNRYIKYMCPSKKKINVPIVMFDSPSVSYPKIFWQTISDNNKSLRPKKESFDLPALLLPISDQDWLVPSSHADNF